MRDEMNNSAAGAAVEEPFFTEEAEEVARPVVPLRQAGAAAPSSMRPRGRLPQSLNLLLAVILAGAAGVVGGYFVFSEQEPRPVVQESAETTPDSPAPQTAVDNGSDAPAVKSDETPPRPETPARAEPERPLTSTAETRPRDEERVERERKRAVPDGEDEARPRREEVAARPESERKRVSSQTVRRREERRVVLPDDEQDGRPKSRLVGTITGRSRRY